MPLLRSFFQSASPKRFGTRLLLIASDRPATEIYGYTYPDDSPVGDNDREWQSRVARLVAEQQKDGTYNIIFQERPVGGRDDDPGYNRKNAEKINWDRVQVYKNFTFSEAVDILHGVEEARVYDNWSAIFPHEAIRTRPSVRTIKEKYNNQYKSTEFWNPDLDEQLEAKSTENNIPPTEDHENYVKRVEEHLKSKAAGGQDLFSWTSTEIT